MLPDNVSAGSWPEGRPRQGSDINPPLEALPKEQGRGFNIAQSGKVGKTKTRRNKKKMPGKSSRCVPKAQG